MTMPLPFAVPTEDATRVHGALQLTRAATDDLARAIDKLDGARPMSAAKLSELLRREHGQHVTPRTIRLARRVGLVLRSLGGRAMQAPELDHITDPETVALIGDVATAYIRPVQHITTEALAYTGPDLRGYLEKRLEDAHKKPQDTPAESGEAAPTPAPERKWRKPFVDLPADLADDLERGADRLAHLAGLAPMDSLRALALLLNHGPAHVWREMSAVAALASEGVTLRDPTLTDVLG